MPTYAEKLRSPKWQRKRLEVLQAAGFKCETCADTEDELHVHHKWYLPKHEPWDYPPECFQVLCAFCHQLVTAENRLLQEVLATAYFPNPLRVAGYAWSMSEMGMETGPIHPMDEEFLEGVCDYHGFTDEQRARVIEHWKAGGCGPITGADIEPIAKPAKVKK